MDGLDAIVASVRRHSVTMDVLRPQSGRSYDGDDYANVGSVDIYVFDPASSGQTPVEGSDQETSMTGLYVPEYDSNGNLITNIKVNDHLEYDAAHRYVVQVKDGLPSELDVELWQLGLDRANG